MSHTTYYAEDYEVLDPGVYDATFLRVEEPKEAGDYGPLFRWVFAVDTAPGEESYEFRDISSRSFKPSTKAREWYEALTGAKLEKGDPVDLEAIEGTPVKLTLTVVTKAKGEFNKIISIRRRSRSPQPARVADPTPDDDPGAFDSLVESAS